MENINTTPEETPEINIEENNIENAVQAGDPAVPAEAPSLDQPDTSESEVSAAEPFVPESEPEYSEAPVSEETAAGDNGVSDPVSSSEPTAEETDSDHDEPSSEEKSSKPADPAAAIEAILFATGNSVKLERLADVLGLSEEELHAAIDVLKERYEGADRGICLTELEDAVQLGTKGEYYEYLIKLAKSPKRMTLSDTVIETLSIIAYKQPVTRAEIERIRGVSCDHAINRLLEYELVEEVGRLDAPGKPLLFGTTEQFLRSFGVRSIQDLPVMSPEMMQDFKAQAEAEAEEDLKVNVDI